MKVRVEQVGDGFQLKAGTKSEEISIGVSPQFQAGTKGLRPMELVLAGFGGCLSIDMLFFLQKMRQPVDDLYVEVTGAREADPPKAFTAIQVQVHCTGAIAEKKMVKVVRMVVDDYCSVFHSLNKAIDLTVRCKLNGEEIMD